MMMKKLGFLKAITATSLATITAATPAFGAELIVNGDFEASTSQTATPIGWTNVGHSDGVIAYSAFGTPAYNGAYFYDFGGYGFANGMVGDGIEQTVTTTSGILYALTFGLSSENQSGISSLSVFFNDVLAGTFSLGVDGSGVFRKPFTTTTINYFANSGSTKITFLQGMGDTGANDPMIDAVSFQAVTSAVPEPMTWMLMLLGFGAMGAAMRKRSKQTSSVSYA
ncbi:PEPxxWA-CTERM sorting domain-containing protein [Allopontixanthobacter sediminis]|nr:PEPxxWA-CTERM sorting domain-containing protein [Allopontixanthobacter sediminis]